MARIALDAMGGDYAPRATVSGALLALAELDAAHTIQLVGRRAEVESQLQQLLAGERAEQAHLRDRLEIIDAAEVIGMSEKPSAAIRSKQNSSMVMGLKLQRDGASDAFVSAGNTGAQMAASVFMLRLHEGLSRPAIGTVLPTAGKPILLLDSGANVDCSPRELVQFARLGAVYAEDVLGRRNPAIGLLSIGEEPEKGNAAVKEAHQLMAREGGLNFIGNIEGRDIPLGQSDHGSFDVVVCDGFVGNVVLKFYESIAPTIVRMVAGAVKATPQDLAEVAKSLDYSEYGGAPLLGVRGVSIISHGKSSDRALKNAIKVAVRAAESSLNEDLVTKLVEPVAVQEKV